MAEDGVAPVADPGPSRRVQVVELLVFLSLIVLSMGSTYFAIGKIEVPFSVAAVAAILHDAGLVVLLLYFVWRNAEPWSRIGWTLKNGWREAALGVALFLPMALTAGLVKLAAHAAGLPASTRLPTFLQVNGPGGIVLGLALVTAAAVAEETVFRGYLILRFRAAVGGTTAAVALSTFVFTCGHFYQGAADMAGVLSIGLMLSGVYLWRGSLVAPILMHLLQDSAGLLLPMLRAQ